MRSIEMTDVDGDALTLLTHENRTWITCTSGDDEVTVGPFPTPLVRRLLSLASRANLGSGLVSLSSSEHTALGDVARDQAGEAISQLSQAGPSPTAMDGALEAVLCAMDETESEDPELVEQFRRVAAAFDRAEDSADRPVPVGDREE